MNGAAALLVLPPSGSRQGVAGSAAMAATVGRVSNCKSITAATIGSAVSSMETCSWSAMFAIVRSRRCVVSGRPFAAVTSAERDVPARRRVRGLLPAVAGLLRTCRGRHRMAPRPSLARIGERPDPAVWADDELITLAEAAHLFFPHGPLTLGGLRSAIARYELTSVSINNRVYTTPGAIRSLIRPAPAAPEPTPPSGPKSLIERARELRRPVRR